MKPSHAINTLTGPDALNGEATSVFVVAKSNFSVEGLLRILSDSGENEIVGCVEPSETCWEKLRTAQPQILLLHYQAVRSPKLEFFTRIATAVPGIRVMVFGQEMDDSFLMDILRAGVAGYINESMNGHDLLDAIREVKDGKLWVERRILEQLAQTAIDMERVLESTVLERINAVRRILSKREASVFKLLLEGLTTKEIAQQIHLSEQSVKLHLGRIFKKFQVSNRSQLILFTFAKICPVNNVSRLIRMALK